MLSFDLKQMNVWITKAITVIKVSRTCTDSKLVSVWLNNENQADKDCYTVHHCHNSHMYGTYETENEVTSRDIFRRHGKDGQVETSHSLSESLKS